MTREELKSLKKEFNCVDDLYDDILKNPTVEKVREIIIAVRDGSGFDFNQGYLTGVCGKFVSQF